MLSRGIIWNTGWKCVKRKSFLSGTAKDCRYCFLLYRQLVPISVCKIQKASSERLVKISFSPCLLTRTSSKKHFKKGNFRNCFNLLNFVSTCCSIISLVKSLQAFFLDPFCRIWAVENTTESNERIRFPLFLCQLHNYKWIVIKMRKKVFHSWQLFILLHFSISCIPSNSLSRLAIISSVTFKFSKLK